MWSVAANASWVSIAGERSGQGPTVINYSVAENPAPAARTATLTVEGVQAQVSQLPAPCRFALSRSGDSVAATGGILSVDVSTLTGCSWTAASQANWIVVTAGGSGSASAAVSLSVAPNTGAQRVGAVTIAGHTYTVTQLAAVVTPPTPPTPPPNPPGPAPPAPTPPPTVVEFNGHAVFVIGQCPELVLRVDGMTVATTRDTDFRRRRCSDLSSGDRVKGRGARNANGVVIADWIEIKDED